MDPTDLIRQAQSSLDKARQTNPTRGSNSKEDEILRINSYTLTACCRCRQARSFQSFFQSVETDFNRGRQDVTPVFHDVYLANAAALSVSTLIETKIETCPATIFFIFKTIYGR